MSHHLFLMRHAKAESEALDGSHDFERQLNTIGYHEALQMGKWLAHKQINIDLILASAAERTKTTAQLVGEQINYAFDDVQLEQEIYQASVRTLMGMIHQIDEKSKSVLIIGHNPIISYLSEFLSGSEIGSMPTAAIAYLTFDIKKWEEADSKKGKLVWFETPNKEESTD